MSFPFNIGDKIEVKNGVGDYSITTPGTILEITNINISYFEAKIVSHNRSSNFNGSKYNFSIKESSNFTVVNEISADDTNYKHRKVISKIRSMDKRRKELGYAY